MATDFYFTCPSRRAAMSLSQLTNTYLYPPHHSSLLLSLPSLLTLFVPLYIFDFSKDIHSCILLMVVCSTLHPTVMASMLRATVPRSNSCSIRLRFYRTETSITKVRRSYLGVSLNRKRRGERGEGEEGRWVEMGVTAPRSNSCSIRLRFYRTDTSTTKVRRSYLGVSKKRKRRGEKGGGVRGERGEDEEGERREERRGT